MRPKELPTQKRLRQMFRYDARSGALFFRPRLDSLGRDMQGHLAGRRAGWISSTGYRCVRVDGEKYRAARIIWKLVHGTEPPVIDHRNGRKPDDRLKNLRPATQALNTRNAGKWKRKRLPKGVRLHACGRYEARIQVDRQCVYLGLFPTARGAQNAYARASGRLHGEFGRTA